MSYVTKATIKSVGLRRELNAEERVPAFDAKIEVPITPELHKILCKGINKPVNLSTLQDAGIDSIKYCAELEGVSLEYSGYVLSSVKINNATVKLNTSLTGSIRLQSQVNNAHGIAEALNEITNEPVTLTIDAEKLSVKIVPDQMDIEDQTENLAPDPAAKNPEPTSTKEKIGESPALHVVGDKGEDLTEAEIAAREKEKDALLKRTTGGSKEESNVSDEVAEALAMINDLEGKKLGQGDENDLEQLKERLEAGRALNQTQVEQLNDLHHRYAA